MSDILSVIMNKRRLRAAISDLTIDQLDSLGVIFEDVIANLKSDYLAVQKEKEEHQQRLNDAINKLAEMGISESDLMQHLGYQLPQVERKTRGVKSGDPSAPKPAKMRCMTKKGQEYHYINSKGQPDVWYGLGRMPVVMRTAIFNGEKTLEDFLVKPKEEAEAV